MYHLPRGKVWAPELLVHALHEHQVDASLEADRISLTLWVEKLHFETARDGTLLKIVREVIGKTLSTLSFDASAVLENILLECNRPFEINCLPQTDAVTAAIVQCGYDYGSERELAKRYYRGEVDLDTMFEEMELLDVKKEQAAARGCFDEARSFLDEKLALRSQVEDLLRSSYREG